MATNNSINISEGTTGQVLVATTGTTPVFNNVVDIINNDFSFQGSEVGLALFNVGALDNTSSGSNAQIRINQGGTSGGTADLCINKGTSRSYSFGMGQTTSTNLVIHTQAAANVNSSSGTELWNMTTTGVRTMPGQSAFATYLSGSISNVTGDGTTYTIPFDVIEFDQDSNFSANTFTAPVNGIYRFDWVVALSNILSTHTSCLVQFLVGGGQNQVQTFNPYNAFNVAQNSVSFAGSILKQLTTGNTCKLAVTVSGGTKTVSIIGSGIASRFSGTLIC